MRASVPEGVGCASASAPPSASAGERRRRNGGGDEGDAEGGGGGGGGGDKFGGSGDRDGGGGGGGGDGDGDAERGGGAAGDELACARASWSLLRCGRSAVGRAWPAADDASGCSSFGGTVTGSSTAKSTQKSQALHLHHPQCIPPCSAAQNWWHPRLVVSLVLFGVHANPGESVACGCAPGISLRRRNPAWRSGLVAAPAGRANVGRPPTGIAVALHRYYKGLALALDCLPVHLVLCTRLDAARNYTILPGSVTRRTVTVKLPVTVLVLIEEARQARTHTNAHTRHGKRGHRRGQSQGWQGQNTRGQEGRPARGGLVLLSKPV